MKIKHFLKSLSSLAGGDESIFIIFDDRFDVWTEELKDSEGRLSKQVSENLVIIPPYFYWDSPESS